MHSIRPAWELNPKSSASIARNEGRGQTNLFLRTVTVSGAGVLRFSDIPIMCLKVCDDINAVIWVKNANTISTLFLTIIAWSGILLSRNSFLLKNVSVGRACFTIFTFHDSYGRNCPLQNECILNIYIKVYMRCLHQCWFLKKYFEEKQLTVLPPWLHPVCDVAKASLLWSVNLPMDQK